jgi:2'-5' RNA ligase
MRYFLYLALPAELTRRVAATEKRFGSYTASRPHVTLITPRERAEGVDERRLVRAVADAASTLAPCKIIYSGLAYFGRKEYIYVPVKKTRCLARCQKACAAAVDGLLRPPALGAPPAFRPHITLVSRLMQQDGTKVWNALRGEIFDGAFLCTRILLLRKGRNDLRWSRVSSFALGTPR